MRHFLIPTALIGVLLAGCGGPGPMMTAPMAPQQEALAWVRTDGQSGQANPALVDQFAADRAACGVMQGADNNALRAAAPCMSGRGYVLVPASQAAATAAQFRAQGGYGGTAVSIGGSVGGGY